MEIQWMKGQTYLLEGNSIEDKIINWFNAHSMEVHKALPFTIALKVAIFGNKEASALKVAIYNLSILDSCRVTTPSSLLFLVLRLLSYPRPPKCFL